MGDRENHSIFFYLSKFAQYFLGAVVVLLFSWYCQVQNTKAPEFTSPTSEELKAKYEIASISPTAKGGFILDWGPYAISDGSYFKIYEVDDLGRNKGRRPLFLLGEQGRFEMGKPLAQCAVDNYAAGAPEAGCSTNFSTAFLEFDANGARFVDDSTGTIVGANKTRHFRITYVHKIAEGKYQSFNLAFCAQGAVSGCHRNQLINGVVVNESQLDTQQTGVLAQSNTIISGRTSFNAREFINARASIEYNKAEERVSVWVTMGHNTYEESSNKTRIDFLLTTKRITYYSRGQQFSDISDTSDIRLRQAAFQWTRVGLILLGMDKETAPNNFFQHILAQEGTYLPSALPNTYAIVISPTYETNQLTRERVLYVSAVNVSDQDSRADSKFDTYRDILNDMNTADPQTNPFASRGTVVKIFGPTADNCAPAVGQPPCLHKFVLGTQMAFPSEPNVYTLNNGVIANRMHMTLLFDQQIPHVRNAVPPVNAASSHFAFYASSQQRTSAIVVFAFQAIATFIVQNVIPMIVNAIVEQVKSSIISAILRDVPLVGDIVRAKDKFESLLNTAKSLHSDLLKAKDLLGNLGNVRPNFDLKPDLGLGAAYSTFPSLTPNIHLQFGLPVKDLNLHLPKFSLNTSVWNDTSTTIKTDTVQVLADRRTTEVLRSSVDYYNPEPSKQESDTDLSQLDIAGMVKQKCDYSTLLGSKICMLEFWSKMCTLRAEWNRDIYGSSSLWVNMSKKIKDRPVSIVPGGAISGWLPMAFAKFSYAAEVADFWKSNDTLLHDYYSVGYDSIRDKNGECTPDKNSCLQDTSKTRTRLSGQSSVFLDLETSFGDAFCMRDDQANELSFKPKYSVSNYAAMQTDTLAGVAKDDIYNQKIFSYCTTVQGSDDVGCILNSGDTHKVSISIGPFLEQFIKNTHLRSAMATYGRLFYLDSRVLLGYAKLKYFFDKYKSGAIANYTVNIVAQNSNFRDLWYNRYSAEIGGNAGTNSRSELHSKGYAIDFNIHDLSRPNKASVLDEFCVSTNAANQQAGDLIQSILTQKLPKNYIVYIEDKNMSFHIEYNPGWEDSKVRKYQKGFSCGIFKSADANWESYGNTYIFNNPGGPGAGTPLRSIEFKILGELSVKAWTGDLNASGQFDGDDYAAFWNGTVSNFEVPMALEKTDSLVLFNWGGASHKVTGNHDLSQPEFPCETAAQVVTPNNWFFCCGGFWCAPCYNVDYRNYSCRIEQWSANGQNGCGGNTWCEAKNNLLQYAIPTTNDLKVRVTRNRVYPTTSCAPNTVCQTTPINYPANDASYLIPTIAYEAFDANKVVHTVSILANEGTGADDNAARANYLSQFAKLPTSATNGANYYFVQRVPMPSYYKNEIETPIYFTKVTDDPATTLNEATVYNVKYVAIPDLASRELIILINEP